jgi:hypothetical protein
MRGLPTRSATHAASRGTYEFHRVHAELTLGLGLRVGHNQVEPAATGAKSDPTDAAAVAHAATPTPVWTGPASSSACASCGSWSITAAISSGAAPWGSTSSRRSCMSGSTTPRVAFPAPKVLTTLTALLDAAQLGMHVGQVLTEIVIEVADVQPTCPRSRHHDQGSRQPTGAHTAGGYWDQPHFRSDVDRRDRRITHFLNSAKFARYTDDSGCARGRRWPTYLPRRGWRSVSASVVDVQAVWSLVGVAAT